MGAKPPRLDGDEVALAIARLSRAPFKQVLRHLLAAAPDVEDVNAFARKYPDRWAQAMAIAARLGGYHDKLQVDANLALDVTRMSDMELMERHAEVEARLAALEADDDGADAGDMKPEPDG